MEGLVAVVVGLGSLSWSTGTTETFPMKLRVGASVQLLEELYVAADMDLMGTPAPGISLGAEYQRIIWIRLLEFPSATRSLRFLLLPSHQKQCPRHPH